MEWLGEVPEHWEVVQLKQFVDIQNGSDHKYVEQAEGYPVMGSGGIFAYASEYLYDGESVLLGRKGTIDKPLHVTGRFWTVDTMYWTKINPEASGRFTYFSALTIPFNYYSTNTALPSMTKGNLSSHLVARPPLSEQTQIASFLDRETEKIDELVAEQRRLMELLKEKRQAVISHAVTQGLNPKAPMKPSGIEWLGDVPEHWAVLSYRNVVTRVVVGIAEAATHAYAEEGVPIVRSTNIKNGGIDQSSMLFIKSEFAAQLESKALLAGDIVTTRTGANVGDSAVVPASLHMSQCFTLVISTPKPESNPHFYNHFINSIPGRLYIQLTAWGSSQPNISVAIIQRMHTAAPPRGEQDAIVAYIERTSAIFDDLIAEAQRAIDLLQERRTALISAAVAGQIDVRKI